MNKLTVNRKQENKELVQTKLRPSDVQRLRVACEREVGIRPTAYAALQWAVHKAIQEAA